MKTVTAAIIIRNGNVLLCRRAPGEKLAGFWEFPGGKLEPGESLQKCLRRELIEELGVDSRPGRILGRSIYRYESGEIELVGMETELIGTKLTPMVHDRVEWVKAGELHDYKLSPADIPLADMLINRRAADE